MSGHNDKIGNVRCICPSKKQTVVALPTCEAEYHALVAASREPVRERRVIGEAEWNTCYPTKLQSDNQSTARLVTG